MLRVPYGTRYIRKNNLHMQTGKACLGTVASVHARIGHFVRAAILSGLGQYLSVILG
jgi:hypothetical protein